MNHASFTVVGLSGAAAGRKKAPPAPRRYLTQGNQARSRGIEVRFRLRVVLAVACLLTTGSQEALAAGVFVNAQAEWIGGPSNVFNPRGTSGLLAIVSKSASYARHFPTYFLQATADAAGYGSDSWRDDVGIPLAMRELAVEPMADARAYGFGTSSEDAYGIAGARVRVYHRVIARAFPPELEETLEPLSVIPIKFRFSLSVSVAGPADQHRHSSAEAIVQIDSENSPFFSREIRIEVSTSEGPLHRELSQTQSFDLRRHRTNDAHTYWLTAFAGVHARGFNRVVANGQAVADPLLQVDPDWEYAPYFAVVQESIRHPGQWIEITREWQNILLRPTLVMSQTNSALTLSWPADAGNFALHRAPNLTSPIVWSFVTNPPVLTTNRFWEVVLPQTNADQQFYQLLSQ